MAFQLIDEERAFIDGDAVYAGESLVNGNLVYRTPAGLLMKSGAGSAPKIEGFAYSRRTNVYRPTSTTIPTSEKMNVVVGMGRVRVDASLFVEAALPAVNAPVFGGAGGLMTVTAGTNQQIGRVRRIDPVNDYIGTGTFGNQAVIEFLFDPTA